MTYLKIFFVLYCGICYSQKRIQLIKEPKSVQQNYWFEKGENSLNKNEYNNSFYYYTRCSMIDTIRPLTEFSKKKSDSLKYDLRTKLLKKIKEKWELVDSGSNWGFNKAENTKTLTVKMNKVIFNSFSNEKNEHIKRVEKINFCDLFGPLLVKYNELIFSDNEIWNFGYTEKGNLHIKNTGQLKGKNRNLISCGNFEKYYR